MQATKLLERLTKVKENGTGRWTARCPAHTDNGPSLSITETDQGKVLIHCFAGCGGAEVLSAVGLEFSDLFPPTDSHDGPRRKGAARHALGPALRSLRLEAAVVLMAAQTLASGNPLTGNDITRLETSASRLRTVLEVIR